MSATSDAHYRVRPDGIVTSMTKASAAPHPGPAAVGIEGGRRFARLSRDPSPAGAGPRSRRPVGASSRAGMSTRPTPLAGKVAPLPGGPRRRPGPAPFFPTTIRRMNGDRRSRGFEPLGATGARALGLSAVRVKDLELQSAWRHVAGPALSAPGAGSGIAARRPHALHRGGVVAPRRRRPAPGARRAVRKPLPGVGRDTIPSHGIPGPVIAGSATSDHESTPSVAAPEASPTLTLRR